MTTIFKLQKIVGGDSGKAELVPPGPQTFSFGETRLSAIISSAGGVTIFPSTLEGNSSNVWISGYSEEAVQKLFGKDSRTTAVEITPRNGEDAFSIRAEVEGTQQELVVTATPSFRENRL